MYTVKREKACTSLDGNGNIKTCYLMHITVDTIADIPDAKENWLAGSRCDVLEDGGHVYELSNGREWVEVNFFDRVSDGDSTDLSNYYTKSQTDERITEKIAEIVADAPEDFDTLKELSDWIYSHEDSAAAMNSAIADNTAAIANKVDKIPGKVLSTNDFTDADKNKLDELENYDDTYIKSEIVETEEQAALNRSTLGYQRKNILKNQYALNSTIFAYGISFTKNEDCSIDVSGKFNGGYGDYYFFGTWSGTSTGYIPKSKNGYIISGLGCTDDVFLRVKGFAEDGETPEILATVTNDQGVKFNGRITTILLTSKNITNDDTINIKPMLRLAEIEDDTYEPYRPSVAEYIENLEARISALENK